MGVRICTSTPRVQDFIKSALTLTLVVLCPGSMPTDYELYYGFTRFAIELNELCPELKDVLPRTDTRFRPDQRYDSDCPLRASQSSDSHNEFTES